MARRLFVLGFMLFSLYSPAQKLIATSDEFPGVPYTGKPPISSSNDGRGFEKSIIYNGGDEVIFMASSARREDESVVKLNSSMKLLWQTNFPDKILFIAQLKNNILVISTPDWKKSHEKFINKINAALLDPATGKLLTEKNVFENTSGVFVDPNLFADEKNNFQALMIRYTEEKKERETNKSYIKKRNTGKLEVISISENLATQSRMLNNDLAGMEFIGGAMNKSGEIFLAGCSDNLLFAEKYQANATSAVAKLSVQYNAHDESPKWGQIAISQAGNALAVAFRYRSPKQDNAILTALFNFADGKAYQYDEVFTKAYKKEADIGNLDDLMVSSIQFAGERIITCKEVQAFDFTSMKTNTIRYTGSQILVTIYDKNFKQLKSIIVTRHYEAFTTDQLYAGCKLNGNSLEVLYTNIAGPAMYATMLALIDLGKLQLISQTELDRGNIKKVSAIEPQAALWFGNTLLVPYIIETGATKQTTIFQKLAVN